MPEMQKPVLEHTPAETCQEKGIKATRPYHRDGGVAQVSQGRGQAGLDTAVRNTDRWYFPLRSSYMSDAEARQIKADIIVELDENEKQLKRLRDKAEQIAKDLQYAAECFLNHPEKLVFRNETTDLRFQTSREARQESFGFDSIKDLRDNIRKLILRQSELRERKAKYD